jgi:hypothetical protein
MNCDSFRKGLRQTAASGREPMGIACEHANGCPSCKAALVREYVLFALIDAGLRAAVSCEILRGFLQRLRRITRSSIYLVRATEPDIKKRS